MPKSVEDLIASIYPNSPSQTDQIFPTIRSFHDNPDRLTMKGFPETLFQSRQTRYILRDGNIIATARPLNDKEQRHLRRQFPRQFP